VISFNDKITQRNIALELSYSVTSTWWFQVFFDVKAIIARCFYPCTANGCLVLYKVVPLTF